MFFKRAPQGNKSVPEEPKDAAAKTVPPLADPHEPLPTSELRRTVDPATLGFETTDKSIRDLLDSHRPKGGDEKWIRKIRMGTFEDSGKCKGSVPRPPRAHNHTLARQLTAPSREQMGLRRLHFCRARDRGAHESA